jgi:UDP-N-acetylmuramyl pentapeptide phosphotransferase/UDP-N-acetylglucosamine-1-phosphate transferase
MTGPASLGYISAVALAAFLAFLLTGIATWYAGRRGLLDHPGERQSHTVVTPRGGGVGLVAALLIVSLLVSAGNSYGFWVQCIVPAVVVLAITGWWDDHASLGVGFRFFIQLAVSFYLLWCATNAGWMQGVIPMIMSGLFMIWMTNLYNFMDGSNGMAGLQGVFAASVLAVLFHLSGDDPFSLFALLLAACCVGFLPWNLGRARVFMGDVGSLALGFLFAAFMLYGTGTGAFDYPVALMVMLLFLTDATLTLMLRVIRGERWYNAHRQHLYQRLIAHGWTHARVAMVYQAINLTLVLPGIVIAVNFPALAWATALALTLIFVLGWYFSISRLGVLAQAG